MSTYDSHQLRAFALGWHRSILPVEALRPGCWAAYRDGVRARRYAEQVHGQGAP